MMEEKYEDFGTKTTNKTHPLEQLKSFNIQVLKSNIKKLRCIQKTNKIKILHLNLISHQSIN